MDGTSQDATRDLAHRVLRAQARLGLGYVLSDGERILDVNDAACRITHYSRDELLALRDPFGLLPPASRDRLREELTARVARGSGAWLLHTPIVQKGGALVPVEIGACIGAGEGDSVEVLAVFREDGAGAPAGLHGQDAAPLPVLVHEAVRGILGAAQMSPTRLSALGGSLAALGEGEGIEHAFRQFSEMGLGHLSLVYQHERQFRFRGDGLVEGAPQRRTTTCYLALGYLTHVVERISGRPAAGTEMACVSRGDAACQFEVRAR